MKKIPYILIFIFSLSSCTNKDYQIKELQDKLQLTEEQLTYANSERNTLKDTVKKRDTKISEYKNQLEIFNSEIGFDLITKDNNLNEFLVYDNLSLLPNGFIKTEGYLGHLKPVTLYEEVEVHGKIEKFISTYNQDGLVFYITDKKSVIYKYLEDVVDNFYFQRDKNWNPGLPVNIQEEDKKLLLLGSSENPVEVVLTFHRLSSYSSDVVVPYASVVLY